MTEKKQKLQEFEALRGLSILLLLALHSEVFDSSVFGFPVDPLAQVVASFLLGSFFFLAGFFAGFSSQKAGANSISFMRSKIIRIFPPYWLALALFVFVLGFSLKRFDALMYAFNLQWLLSPAFYQTPAYPVVYQCAGGVLPYFWHSIISSEKSMRPLSHSLRDIEREETGSEADHRELHFHPKSDTF